jgi:hypothetical protein
VGSARFPAIKSASERLHPCLIYRAVPTVLTMRASIQANRDQPLCRKIRSISCLISESLLTRSSSKCFRCAHIFGEGDNRMTVEFANCQIEATLLLARTGPTRSRTPVLWPAHSLDWVSTRRISIASRNLQLCDTPSKWQATIQKG